MVNEIKTKFRKITTANLDTVDNNRWKLNQFSFQLYYIHILDNQIITHMYRHILNPIIDFSAFEQWKNNTGLSLLCLRSLWIAHTLRRQTFATHLSL